jgi:hypothetical protein
MRLFFQNTVSPAQLYLSDSKTSLAGGTSTFFISHILDATLFSLIETSLTAGRIFTLIFNQVGYSDEQRRSNLLHFNRLREKGARVYVVNSAETIVEDLEGKPNEIRV